MTKKDRKRARVENRAPLSRIERGYQSRWYAPGTGPPDWAKVYMSYKELRELISCQLHRKLSEDFHLYCADDEYYCPPVGDASKIIKNSRLDRRNWVAEKFDCDDFAHVLKANFSEAAYKDGRRRRPHCFGIIWGAFPHAHAINWMVNCDLKLRFVEPQSGRIYFPRVDDRDIWFMLA